MQEGEGVVDDDDDDDDTIEGEVVWVPGKPKQTI